MSKLTVGEGASLEAAAGGTTDGRGSAPTSPPDPESSGSGSRRSLVHVLGLDRFSALYLWGFFLVLFGLLAPQSFLTETTFRLVFSEGVVTCIIALAFLVPLATGAYDLSVGAVMSFALAISVYLQTSTSLSPVVGALIAMVACMLVGTITGFIVVKLKVNSFIGTLGVSQVLLAGVLLISGNRQIVGDFPQSWVNVGTASVLGIPVVVLYLLVLAAILWFVLEHTRVGRYLFATGGNVEATRLSGVRTDRMIWGALIASATIAGFAGVIYSMRTGVFTSSIGPGYLFPAVAAVFLGASQLSRRPNVWGTLIAYFTLAFGAQGLSLAASSAAAWSRPLFEGIALIIAVALASRPAVRKLKQRRSPTTGAATESPS